MAVQRRFHLRSVAACIVLALASSLGFSGTVLAEVTTTTTYLQSFDPPTPSGAFVPFTVVGGVTFPGSISIDPSGTLSVHDHINGGDVVVGSGPFVYNTLNYISVPNGLDLGTHPLTLVYAPINPDIAGSESTSTDYVISIQDSNSVTYAPTTIETHHTFVVSEQTNASNFAWWQNATVDFMRSGSAVPICNDVPVAQDDVTKCTAPSLPVGTYDLWVVYSGNSRTNGSTSPHVTLTVTADVVHATGVGVQYATFYPSIDGYLDTDAIRGSRQEPISVYIRIYNSANSLVKAVSLPLASGSFSYAWNGRNSAGTILAEGKYRVYTRLTDAASTTSYVTNYITLSKKHLIYHTVYITKLGSSVSASGHFGSGTVTLNTTSGYARLSVPGIYTNWAGVGWQFALPAATLYKSMYVRVYGHHNTVPIYTNVGAQNFASCAYIAGADWDESCFGAWGSLTNTTGSNVWSSSTFLGSAYRYGRTVRALVSSYAGTTYIYKAQAKVYYAVLGY